MPLKEATIPTPEDVQELLRQWQERAPRRYKNLLSAVPVGAAVDSEWYYDTAKQQYVSDSGREVDNTEIKALFVAMFIGRLGAPAKETGAVTWEGLAESLRAGKISVAEWQQGMGMLIQERQEIAMILANGGENFVTLSDWEFAMQQTQNQFAYLENFANDIANNPDKWLNGRLNARMDLYRESGYSALQTYQRQQATESGMDEERRVLGVADHCDGCLEQASLGWQPIGTLDPIGAEDCATRCRCEFEFRNSKDQTE